MLAMTPFRSDFWVARSSPQEWTANHSLLGEGTYEFSLASQFDRRVVDGQYGLVAGENGWI
jgi:hypothetical protein